jgi:hypothetical protein
MKVKATRLGYYDHKRRKPEAVFDMRPEDYNPGNGHANCSWVEPLESFKKETSNSPKTKGRQGMAKLIDAKSADTDVA